MSFTPRQLLAMAERALDVLDWGQVYALASDVLVLEPANAEASMLRALAERHDGRSSLPGRRQATALFADLVGSTRLAERHDVEIYCGVLRAFVDACRPAIDDHEGHLIDVKGDGIVACFGYPNAHEDDACRAVSAGLDMLAALRPVAAELRAERGIELQLRVGIDTGLVVIDGAGVSGATMNRASRLQSLAAPDSVLISATTNELVAERFETRALGRRELKGVDAPVEVFRVLQPHDRSCYGPVRRRPSLPFIGRDAELEQVLTLWHQMLAARAASQCGVPLLGDVVLIVGEPGIGKSRLVSEVVERTAQQAIRAIQLYCSAYSTTSTLFPFRAAIESYTGMRPGDSDDERLVKLETACADLGVESAELIPALGAVFGFELNGRYPPLDLSPVQLQKVLLDRLTAALPAIASDGPAILVFEDLQWADPTTLEVLDRLASAGLPAGLLILGTARPGLRWVPSDDTVRTIRLDPLPDGHARELAMAAGTGRMSEQDAREIAARGDGVPLFVEQLAQTFGGMSGPALARCASDVPRTLIQLLQARLDAVGDAKLVAQVAATIGREFRTSALEAVMAHLASEGPKDAGAAPVEQHLKQLADVQLIEPMDHDGQLRFRHILMRDAAYQSQLMRDRGARHGAVAEVLAEAKTADSALTAFHFDHAERPLEALVHYLQAVRRAQAAGSFAEVLAHLARCEGLLADVPDENVRAQFELAVRLNRGLAVSSTVGYAADPGVLADYNRARELCTTLDGVPGVGKELLKVLFAVWNYYCASGDFDTAGMVCSEIERRLDRTTLRSGQHGLDACRGVEAFYRYDFRRAEQLLSRAVAGMARDGVDQAEWWQPHDPMAASCAFLGPLRFVTGDETGALDAIQTGLECTQPLEFPRGPFSVAFVRMFESVLHRRRQDATAAAAAAEEVIRIGKRHGYYYWELLGQLHLAAAKAMTDRSSAAPEAMGAALTAWSAVGGEPLVPPLLVEQADAYLACEELEKATTCLTRGFEGMAQGHILGLSEALRVRAELRLRADPAAVVAADADLREAIGISRVQADVYSALRAALTHRRLLHSEGDDLVDTALVDAVAAYGESTTFPDLAEARVLLVASGRIRSG